MEKCDLRSLLSYPLSHRSCALVPSFAENTSTYRNLCTNNSNEARERKSNIKTRRTNEESSSGIKEWLLLSFSVSFYFLPPRAISSFWIFDLSLHWKFISSVESHDQSSFPFNPKMPTAISSLPIIKVRIRKIARRRKLTCSGKGKSKWQLTALLWLSASVYVDGRERWFLHFRFDKVSWKR